MRSWVKPATCLLLLLLLAGTVRLGFAVRHFSLNYQLGGAVLWNNNQKVAQCLRLGADVNSHTYHGIVPIRLAVRRQHYATVALLLAYHPAVDEALADAVMLQDARLVVLLLDHGANPYARNPYTKAIAFDDASPAMKRLLLSPHAPPVPAKSVPSKPN